jgi:hypothetical protein
MPDKKPYITWGRCPDCGAAVEVEIRKPLPGRVLPHGCPARACEYPACRVVELQERMFRYDDGAWYCPRHGLVVASRALVALYRVEGEADWSAVSELIGETLPEILRRIDATERSSGRLDSAHGP